MGFSIFFNILSIPFNNVLHTPCIFVNEFLASWWLLLETDIKTRLVNPMGALIT